MANPHDDNRPDHAADRGFNNIQSSAIDKRRKNLETRKYTFFAVIALFSLLVLMLLITLIGAIVSNIADNGGSKGPAKTEVEWTEVPLTDADTLHGDLVLVNSTHQYTFPETNEHLTKIVDVLMLRPSPRPYQQSGLSEFMDTDALKALDTMLADFAAASGKTNVRVGYAYRSAADQAALGSTTKSGFSDHHTGLGCDLKYIGENGTYELSNDPAYAWLTENCHKYGFVIRYPEDKSAATGVAGYDEYFRFVGVAHATYMKQNNLCMEEYIELLKGYTPDKPLAINAADGNYYEVCYVAVSGHATVKCPSNYAYMLSGTNEGGVVLTVNRSEVLGDETDSGTGTGTDTDTEATGTAKPSEILPG